MGDHPYLSQIGDDSYRLGVLFHILPDYDPIFHDLTGYRRANDQWLPQSHFIQINLKDFQCGYHILIVFFL